MSAIFGKLLFNLPLEKFRKDHAKEYIAFYQRFFKSKDLIVRKNAAFIMPCSFYYFGNYDSEEGGDLDFSEIYCELADDDNIEIKAIIGRGIHEAILPQLVAPVRLP